MVFYHNNGERFQFANQSEKTTELKDKFQQSARLMALTLIFRHSIQ
jgi:hypothetical protein